MSKNKKGPSALQDHLGFWMRFVSNQVSARFAAELAGLEVTVTEWVAMRTLYDRQIASHAILIEVLGMTKGAASKVLSKLEARGLLERRYGPHDAKSQLLRLTPGGRKLVVKLARLADENDHHYFGHLEPEQRAALRGLLEGLVEKHQLKTVPTA